MTQVFLSKPNKNLTGGRRHIMNGLVNWYHFLHRGVIFFFNHSRWSSFSFHRTWRIIDYQLYQLDATELSHFTQITALQGFPTDTSRSCFNNIITLIHSIKRPLLRPFLFALNSLVEKGVVTFPCSRVLALFAALWDYTTKAFSADVEKNKQHLVASHRGHCYKRTYDIRWKDETASAMWTDLVKHSFK